jgi:hypothetical protein
MKNLARKIEYLLIVISLVLVCIQSSFATNYYNGFDPNLSQYYNPNYQYYPNYNGYGYNGMNTIPANSYYYIAGYDRETQLYCNGQPMATRIPILGGNNYFPTSVANGIVYNAYLSISKWCNENILTKDGIQDYFLNYATIVSATASRIVMNVNCAHKRAGILNGHTNFRVNVDISRNRYKWVRADEGSSIFINDNSYYDDDYYYRDDDDDDDDEYELYDGERIIIIK